MDGHLITQRSVTSGSGVVERTLLPYKAAIRRSLGRFFQQAIAASCRFIWPGAMQLTIESINMGGVSGTRPWNPLTDDSVGSRSSSYLGVRDGRLLHLLEPERTLTQLEQEIHDQIRERILMEGYPCVGARSAFNRRTYRVGVYGAMCTPQAVRGTLYDLYEFCHEHPVVGDEFITFISVFPESKVASELQFEHLLWKQLELMHRIDAQYFSWDPAVSSDPADPRFSFSIGQRAFFIVGLHSQASRSARLVPWPIIVFNLHAQFERLRQRGKFETMKTMIRARDLVFHGSPNPMLQNFGEASEAMQYSGRKLPADWVCPFHHKKAE